MRFLLIAQWYVMSLEMIISQNSIALTLFRNYLSQFFILECIFCQIYQKNMLQSESWRIMFIWREKQKKSGRTMNLSTFNNLTCRKWKRTLTSFQGMALKRFDKFTDNWRFFSYLSRQTKKPRITRRHRYIWPVQGKFQSFSIAVESSFFINNTHIHTDASFSSFSSIYRIDLLYFLGYHTRINLPWVFVVFNVEDILLNSHGL